MFKPTPFFRTTLTQGLGAGSPLTVSAAESPFAAHLQSGDHTYGMIHSADCAGEVKISRTADTITYSLVGDCPCMFPPYSCISAQPTYSALGELVCNILSDMCITNQCDNPPLTAETGKELICQTLAKMCIGSQCPDEGC